MKNRSSRLESIISFVKVQTQINALTNGLNLWVRLNTSQLKNLDTGITKDLHGIVIDAVSLYQLEKKGLRLRLKQIEIFYLSDKISRETENDTFFKGRNANEEHNN